jgi:Nucleotidyl transferase AbiEii toxin, Type IV TA system
LGTLASGATRVDQSLTQTTRAATWQDVLHLGASLNASGCDYALIGGYALSAHGIGRMSEDIDFLVDPSPSNTPKWVQALSILEDKADARVIRLALAHLAKK